MKGKGRGGRGWGGKEGRKWERKEVLVGNVADEYLHGCTVNAVCVKGRNTMQGGAKEERRDEGSRKGGRMGRESTGM